MGLYRSTKDWRSSAQCQLLEDALFVWTQFRFYTYIFFFLSSNSQSPLSRSHSLSIKDRKEFKYSSSLPLNCKLQTEIITLGLSNRDTCSFKYFTVKWRQNTWTPYEIACAIYQANKATVWIKPFPEKHVWINPVSCDRSISILYSLWTWQRTDTDTSSLCVVVTCSTTLGKNQTQHNNTNASFHWSSTVSVVVVVVLTGAYWGLFCGHRTCTPSSHWGAVYPVTVFSLNGKPSF